MLALGWFIFKAWALLILLALSGKGVGFVLSMVIEDRPWIIRRLRWLTWGFVAAGIAVIVAAACKLLVLIFA